MQQGSEQSRVGRFHAKATKYTFRQQQEGTGASDERENVG